MALLDKSIQIQKTLNPMEYTANFLAAFFPMAAFEMNYSSLITALITILVILGALGMVYMYYKVSEKEDEVTAS